MEFIPSNASDIYAFQAGVREVIPKEQLTEDIEVTFRWVCPGCGNGLTQTSTHQEIAICPRPSGCGKTVIVIG